MSHFSNIRNLNTLRNIDDLLEPEYPYEDNVPIEDQRRPSFNTMEELNEIIKLRNVSSFNSEKKTCVTYQDKISHLNYHFDDTIFCSTELIQKINNLFEEDFGMKDYCAVICDTANPYKIVACSKKWAIMCGYKTSELLGKPISLIQGSLTDKFKANEFTRNFVNRKFGEIQLINYKKNGDSFVNNISSIEIDDGSGNGRFYMTFSSSG